MESLELATLVHRSMSEVNNEIRGQAEAKLNELRKRWGQFVDS